jgi:hypothetical protein
MSLRLSTPDRDPLPDRAVRALTETMLVTDDVDIVRGADACYLVWSETGKSYFVDAREQVCQCPDHEYREAECKHIRRVNFATGREPMPAYLDADAVDPLLGRSVSRAPVVWASDGVELWGGP